MASIFGHVAASTALGYAFFPKAVRPVTLALAGFAAFAPDLDVIGFALGIPYNSPLGHRGFTHSAAVTLFFGVLLGVIYQKVKPSTPIPVNTLLLWLAISCLSHPLLDMLTDGGRGCALWWPFSEERIFFPVRPILVSPLGASSFFSAWGLRVLLSEFFWIGVPSLALVLLAKSIKRNRELE